ncbi:thiopeptide-type bacteriocin biosynthesis protein [Tsukamurella paurometabola]|uniref:Thiopeptide-type bacteriocin biosynthesis domain n=1 Tax=Tsukamurella paurometabola TaxID=2061 RepID=A0A3P8LDV8_TSUPA|nr:thiopeptide-type bacteriocin biosynthesis protein [Tsukamurella paurometabola]UEA81448.1 lantibiotic dehydratase [Tsukamurella paurometabola]VDR38442.1 thiopeptide-type bacteriocin biosynthesis domain [Tsukamurella paurometabola]
MRTNLHVDPDITLRCAVRPVDAYPATKSSADRNDALAQLCELWTCSDLRAAVEVSSESLLATWASIVEGRETRERQIRKVWRSVLSYAIRSTTRATPFGLFGGIAVVPVVDGGEVLLDSGKHRAVVRSSSFHRKAVAANRAEELNGMVATNPSVHLKGGRYVVRLPSSGERTQVSIRATPPARSAVHMAREPISAAAIVQRLSADHPDVESEVVSAMVRGLIDSDVLIPIPGMSVVTARPEEGEAEFLFPREAVDRVRNLRSRAAKTRNAALVDIELAAGGGFPAELIANAAPVLDMLLRTTVIPHRSQRLHDFATRFGERFGHTLVPLRVAVDPDDGVGMPDFSADDPGTRAAADGKARLRARLIERARTSGSGSIELLDADLEDLDVDGDLVDSYDLFLHLERRGSRPVLTLTPVTSNFPAGRGIGRFTPGSEAAHRSASRQCEREVLRSPETVFAQLDYVSARDGVNDVSTTAQLYPAVLAANTWPRDAARTLQLSDVHLALVGDHVRLFLGDGTPLELRQPNMVSPESLPEILRLLVFLTWDGAVRPYWSWGGAEQALAHLPEVVFRDVVVSRQRWRYLGADKPTAAQVRDWTSRSGVSRYVYHGEFDNRLLLDLTCAGHLELLAAGIARGSTWVTEAPSPQDLGTTVDDAGRLHSTEVVVSIAAEPLPRTAVDYPVFDETLDGQRRIRPGGTWASLEFPVDLDDQNRILGAIGTAIGRDADWYYVRYNDRTGRDVLRLRCRSPLDELSILDLLADLRSAGEIGDLVITSHHLELERYGGIDRFAKHEKRFCAESRIIAEHIDRLPAPTEEDDEAGQRERIRGLAALVDGWLSATIGDEHRIHGVSRIALAGYESELGDEVHAIRRRVRGLQIEPETAQWLTDELCDMSSIDDPIAPLQSALHLFCNRLGMTRADEYAALWIRRTTALGDERREECR